MRYPIEPHIERCEETCKEKTNGLFDRQLKTLLEKREEKRRYRLQQADVLNRHADHLEQLADMAATKRFSKEEIEQSHKTITKQHDDEMHALEIEYQKQEAKLDGLLEQTKEAWADAYKLKEVIEVEKKLVREAKHKDAFHEAPYRVPLYWVFGLSLCVLAYGLTVSLLMGEAFSQTTLWFAMGGTLGGGLWLLLIWDAKGEEVRNAEKRGRSASNDQSQATNSPPLMNGYQYADGDFYVPPQSG